MFYYKRFYTPLLHYIFLEKYRAYNIKGTVAPRTSKALLADIGLSRELQGFDENKKNPEDTHTDRHAHHHTHPM